MALKLDNVEILHDLKRSSNPTVVALKLLFDSTDSNLPDCPIPTVVALKLLLLAGMRRRPDRPSPTVVALKHGKLSVGSGFGLRPNLTVVALKPDVIAMIAILLRSKGLFFLLFSAIFAFLRFDGKMINTQIPNVTFHTIQ